MPPVRLTVPPPPTIAPPPASDTAATVADESTPASAPTKAKGKGPQGKIALLFLIYEEIHQPELWRAFLESADRLYLRTVVSGCTRSTYTRRAALYHCQPSSRSTTFLLTRS